MNQKGYRRRTGTLWAMVLLALAYRVLLHFVPSLTGRHMLDGLISVLLGLYICSHPAANAIDSHFLHRGVLQDMVSEWAGVGWLALNVLVLVVGWIVIAIGTRYLVGAPIRS